MRELIHQVFTTAENAGIKVISDDHCCRLMAWLYAYGGGVEAVLFNVKMNEHIMLAQKRLNINGGEIPNLATFGLLKSYLNDVEQVLRKKTTEHPAWAYELCDYYNIPRGAVS